MNFPFVIEVHLLEFFKTGVFDCLRFGETKEYLYHNISNPSNCTHKNEFYQNNIWVYGDLELWFEGDFLQHLFADWHKGLDFGNAFKVDTWILQENAHPTLETVIRELNAEGMDYAKNTMPTSTPNIPLGIDLMLNPSKVKLSFHPIFLDMLEENFITERLGSNAHHHRDYQRVCHEWEQYQKTLKIDHNLYQLGAFYRGSMNS